MPAATAVKHASPRTTRVVPSIIFVPADKNIFKQEFLMNKVATIIWKYSDGHEEIKTWQADKLSADSDIRANIQSKPEWRRKDVDGLIEVVVKV